MRLRMRVKPRKAWWRCMSAMVKKIRKRSKNKNKKITRKITQERREILFLRKLEREERRRIQEEKKEMKRTLEEKRERKAKLRAQRKAEMKARLKAGADVGWRRKRLSPRQILRKMIKERKKHLKTLAKIRKLHAVHSKIHREHILEERNLRFRMRHPRRAINRYARKLKNLHQATLNELGEDATELKIMRFRILNKKCPGEKGGKRRKTLKQVSPEPIETKPAPRKPRRKVVRKKRLLKKVVKHSAKVEDKKLEITNMEKSGLPKQTRQKRSASPKVEEKNENQVITEKDKKVLPNQSRPKRSASPKVEEENETQEITEKGNKKVLTKQSRPTRSRTPKVEENENLEITKKDKNDLPERSIPKRSKTPKDAAAEENENLEITNKENNGLLKRSRRKGGRTPTPKVAAETNQNEHNLPKGSEKSQEEKYKRQPRTTTIAEENKKGHDNILHKRNRSNRVITATANVEPDVQSEPKDYKHYFNDLPWISRHSLGAKSPRDKSFPKKSPANTDDDIEKDQRSSDKSAPANTDDDIEKHQRSSDDNVKKQHSSPVDREIETASSNFMKLTSSQQKLVQKLKASRKRRGSKQVEKSKSFEKKLSANTEDSTSRDSLHPQEKSKKQIDGSKYVKPKTSKHKMSGAEADVEDTSKDDFNATTEVEGEADSLKHVKFNTRSKDKHLQNANISPDTKGSKHKILHNAKRERTTAQVEDDTDDINFTAAEGESKTVKKSTRSKHEHLPNAHDSRETTSADTEDLNKYDFSSTADVEDETAGEKNRKNLKNLNKSKNLKHELAPNVKASPDAHNSKKRVQQSWSDSVSQRVKAKAQTDRSEQRPKGKSSKQRTSATSKARSSDSRLKRKSPMRKSVNPYQADFEMPERLIVRGQDVLAAFAKRKTIDDMEIRKSKDRRSTSRKSTASTSTARRSTIRPIYKQSIGDMKWPYDLKSYEMEESSGSSGGSTSISSEEVGGGDNKRTSSMKSLVRDSVQEGKSTTTDKTEESAVEPELLPKGSVELFKELEKEYKEAVERFDDQEERRSQFHEGAKARIYERRRSRCKDRDGDAGVVRSEPKSNFMDLVAKLNAIDGLKRTRKKRRLGKKNQPDTFSLESFNSYEQISETVGYMVVDAEKNAPLHQLHIAENEGRLEEDMEPTLTPELAAERSIENVMQQSREDREDRKSSDLHKLLQWLKEANHCATKDATVINEVRPKVPRRVLLPSWMAEPPVSTMPANLHSTIPEIPFIPVSTQRKRCLSWQGLSMRPGFPYHTYHRPCLYRRHSQQNDNPYVKCSSNLI